MFDWSKNYLLKFHPDNYVSICISKKDDKPHQYFTNGQSLKSSEEEKAFCIIIDSELSFRNHMSANINKANSDSYGNHQINNSTTRIHEESFLIS